MILRRLARPMLAATFVYGGINALRQPEGHVQAARPLLDKMIGSRADQIPDDVPTDAETLVKIDAGVKIGAGLALALGKAPRLAALLLLGSLGATTAATHRFWEETEPGQRDAQLVHFLKNCGLAGGLLLAAADTHGKPSAAWWARHSAHMAGDWLEGTTRAAQRTAKHNVKHAKHGASQAKLQARHGVKHSKHGVKQAKLGAGSKAQNGFRKAKPSGMRKHAGHNGFRKMDPAALKRMRHTGSSTAGHRIKQAQLGARAQARRTQAQAHAHKAQAEARKAVESTRNAMAR